MLFVSFRYGTGCFLLYNTGDEVSDVKHSSSRITQHKPVDLSVCIATNFFHVKTCGRYCMPLTCTVFEQISS